MFLPECPFYVGIDPAAETHAVCALDAAGKIRAEFTIAHTADGFAELLGRLGSDRIGVPVGIERPDGRLVDALLEAGHPVVPVSPNAIKTWREGEVCSGAKSDVGDVEDAGDAGGIGDAGDAGGIAEYLRLRTHRLRPAAPYTTETKALRTVVRTCDDIVGPHQSGKHRAVHFRWACNKRFHAAISTFADNSRHTSHWAASAYARAIARGHDHPPAVRVLARAWIRVICRCWLDGISYDPARHGNAAELAGHQAA